MNALKFTLYGKTAFFKSPDINTRGDDIYFSFPHVHKLTILGILGSIIGLKGYNQQNDEQYPEFYQILKSIQISIVPAKNIFKQRMVYQTNTTGCANYEKNSGCFVNFIWNEKWLEDVSWDIYIMDDGSNIFKEIKNKLENSEAKHPIYLGNNQHFASIKDVEYVQLNKTSSKTLSSIIVDSSNDNCIQFGEVGGRTKENYISFFAPIGLNKPENHYIFRTYYLTNKEVITEIESYSCNGKNIMFF